MPLAAVQFRADPVLYKDNPKKSNKGTVESVFFGLKFILYFIDNVDKKYENMGAL